MLIVEVVVAVVVGVFLVGVYRDAKNGTLPLQNSVGIKTPATMSSEDTWNRTHKQYAPIFLVDACALFLIALEIIIGGGHGEELQQHGIGGIDCVGGHACCHGAGQSGRRCFGRSVCTKMR